MTGGNIITKYKSSLWPFIKFFLFNKLNNKNILSSEIIKEKDSDKNIKKNGKEENNLERLRRILNDDN